MTRSTRTLVVDQNDLFREGLRRILADTAFRVAKDGASLEQVLSDLSDKIPPQLLLLSASPDYVATAYEVQRFKTGYPDARVVVLSEQCDFDSVMAILRAGANGFVLKRIESRAFTKALDLVMLGQSVLSSSVIDPFTHNRFEPHAGTQALAGPRRAASGGADTDGTTVSRNFSSREVEILHCLTRGEANKLIARKFEIAEATVKVHIKAILRKINVKNRTQAAIWADHHLPEWSESIADQTASVENGVVKDPPIDS